MPILKELAVAAAALVLFFFINAAFPVPDDQGKPSATGDRPWIGAEFVPAERWLVKDLITTGKSWNGADPTPVGRGFGRDLTPHARIKGVFAQFIPSESRRAI